MSVPEALPLVLQAPQQAFAPCPRQLGLYAVVPDADWVAQLVELGVPTVQLRYKETAGGETALRQQIQAAAAAAKGRATRLFINDHWQIAVELALAGGAGTGPGTGSGIYGVHLGQEDIERADLDAIQRAGLRLGISTHGVAELDRALAVRPSYVACGAVYATTTKQMPTQPQGLENLAVYVRQAGDTPVVAIGGIDLARMPAVLATGVGSVAVVRAITEAADVPAAVAQLQACFAAHALTR